MPVIIALLYFTPGLVFRAAAVMMAVILIGCTIAFLLYTRLFRIWLFHLAVLALFFLWTIVAALIVAHPL
ncbi:MAG: hypothetical protein ACLVJ6_05590 [Merdibacter sp.]